MVSQLTVPAMRHRPIYGGVFGKGRYSLATMPCIANGLHAVRYMVIEPRAGSVLAQAGEKLEALANARRLLRATSALALQQSGHDLGNQGALWPSLEMPVLVPGARRRPVSRRRREIFERSRCQCHYCGTGLTLEGKWHVEHMVPRALDGGDQPINLVAACVKCNLAKSDRTALEFVTAKLPDYRDDAPIRPC